MERDRPGDVASALSTLERVGCCVGPWVAVKRRRRSVDVGGRRLVAASNQLWQTTVRVAQHLLPRARSLSRRTNHCSTRLLSNELYHTYTHARNLISMSYKCGDDNYDPTAVRLLIKDHNDQNSEQNPHGITLLLFPNLLLYSRSYVRCV